jgi:DNA-binding MarR family transcriptional regulator
LQPVTADDERLAAWRALLHAHLTVTTVLNRELEAEAGLPLTWYDVLLTLHDAGGRLRMQELARSVLLSKSGVTRLVDRMARAGLVTREPCEDDRRGLLAVLTDAGEAALRRAAPVHLRGIDEHFCRHLDDHDAGVVHRALARVIAASEGAP